MDYLPLDRLESPRSRAARRCLENLRPAFVIMRESWRQKPIASAAEQRPGGANLAVALVWDDYAVGQLEGPLIDAVDMRVIS